MAGGDPICENEAFILRGTACSIGGLFKGWGAIRQQHLSSAYLWYASTRTERPPLLTYKGHHGATVTAFSWSSGELHIASGDIDGTLLVWDTATGKTSLICREATAKGVVSVSWSPDGTSILAGYINMLVIWNVQSGKKTFTTTHLSAPATYSLVGDYKPCFLAYSCLLAACQNQQSVLVFPSTSLKAPITSFDPGSISTLDLAIITAAPSKQIIVYGASIPNTCAQNGPPNTVIGYIATADAEGTVRAWGNDGKYNIAMQSNYPVRQIVGSPDGNFLAAAHSDGTVQVWQAQLSDLPAKKITP